MNAKIYTEDEVEEMEEKINQGIDGLMELREDYDLPLVEISEISRLIEKLYSLRTSIAMINE